MINRKINLNILQSVWREPGHELYLNILVNVVVGYLIAKGYTVEYTLKKNEIEAIIFLEDVIISVRIALISFILYEDLAYYLNVFLGQDVAPNRELDYEMMKRLGELYPRQLACAEMPVKCSLFLPNNWCVYKAFLNGINPFSGLFIYSWKERVKNLANWLDTIIIDLSKRQPIWQKLYEAAVCSINAQPLASHYLVFDRNIADHFYLKLNKEQYFKVLGIYLSTDFFYKKAGYYVEILNLEIMSFDFLTDELEHETFQVVFPQVFTAFSLTDWNISNDFLLDLHWKIKKVYVSKLLVKYHKFLSVLFSWS